MELENLIYDSTRLSCTAEEKESCLETAAKLARLGKLARRDGPLAVLDLAEKEKDPFFRACLLEAGEFWDAAELKKLFAAYLAAGDYRGGAFLNAVLIVKGLLLFAERCAAGIDPPAAWGRLLSAELRGFFGAEYRERVMAVIEWETRRPRREVSVVPEFDQLAELSPARRQRLLQDTAMDDRVLAIALSGAGAAVKDALWEAAGEQKQEFLKKYLPYLTNLRQKDVSDAQNEILKILGKLG